LTWAEFSPEVQGMTLYAQLLALLAALSELLTMLTAFFKVLPQMLGAWSAYNLASINDEILRLEERGSADDRPELGRLRLKQDSARKLNEALLAGIAPPQGGKAGADK
jgi:hypothetical protein